MDRILALYHIRHNYKITKETVLNHLRLQHHHHHLHQLRNEQGKKERLKNTETNLKKKHRTHIPINKKHYQIHSTLHNMIEISYLTEIVIFRTKQCLVMIEIQNKSFRSSSSGENDLIY